MTINVGLLWHSVNSDNLGVGALTASHLALLRDIATELEVPLRFRIFGWRDPRPAYVAGPDVEMHAIRPRDLLNPGGLYDAVRDCDLVLDISAGDSFADIYGTRRFAYNLLSKLVVLAARRPLALSPQTIGPFDRWWTKPLAALTMRGAQRVVTRDALSSDYLKSMGLGHKLIEATDVAFRLPFDEQRQPRSGKTKVGLNISGLLYNGGHTRNNSHALTLDYPALADRLCAYFAGRADCELHLVGHVNSETNSIEDDYRVARLLAEKHPGAVLAPVFADPSQAKSYIAGLDFFAGSRMHACIAAFSSGVPVVPMAYSRKFLGLFGSLGYDHVADCRELNTDDARDAVIGAFSRRGQLRVDLEAALARAEAKLSAYEDFLHHTLKELAWNTQNASSRRA